MPCILIEILTVAGDDFLIPEEGVLSASGEVSGIIVVPVNVNCHTHRI